MEKPGGIYELARIPVGTSLLPSACVLRINDGTKYIADITIMQCEILPWRVRWINGWILVFFFSVLCCFCCYTSFLELGMMNERRTIHRTLDTMNKWKWLVNCREYEKKN